MNWNNFNKHKRQYRVVKSWNLYAVQSREAGPFFSFWVTNHFAKNTRAANKLMDILANRDEEAGVAVDKGAHEG